jgi:hypothetical protein
MLKSNPLPGQFQEIRQREVLLSKRRALLISGMTSLGKTYSLDQLSREMNIEVPKINPKNERELVFALWRHREKRAVRNDDADRFLRSETIINVYKVMCEPYGKRIIIYETQEVLKNQRYKDAEDERYNPDIPPREIEVTQGNIMITNLPLDGDLKHIAANMREHVEALAARGGVINLSRNPLYRFDYTLYLVSQGLFQRQPQPFSFDICMKAVDWFVAQRNYLHDAAINPRTLVLIAEMIRNSPETWEDRCATRSLARERQRFLSLDGVETDLTKGKTLYLPKRTAPKRKWVPQRKQEAATIVPAAPETATNIEAEYEANIRRLHPPEVAKEIIEVLRPAPEPDPASPAAPDPTIVPEPDAPPSELQALQDQQRKTELTQAKRSMAAKFRVRHKEDLGEVPQFTNRPTTDADKVALIARLRERTAKKQEGEDVE